MNNYSSPIEKDFHQRYNACEEKLKEVRNYIKKADYENALKDCMRGITTDVSKIIMGDLMKEDEALEILKGQKMFIQDNTRIVKKTNPKGKAEGKFLIDQAALCLKEKNEDKKELVESDIVALIRALNNTYNISTPKTHGSSINDSFDPSISARESYLRISSIFINFSSLSFASKETKLLAEKLREGGELYLDDKISPDYAANDIELINEKTRIRNKIDDILGEYSKAILLVSADFMNFIGDVHKIKDLLSFRWTLIIDYNKKSKEGLFENLPKELKEKMNCIITPDYGEDSFTSYNITDGIHRPNWLFAAGDDNLKTRNRTEKVTRKYIAQILKELRKEYTGTMNLCFFVFLKNMEIKLFSDIVRKIDDEDNLGENFGEDFNFFVFTDKGSSYQEWNNENLLKDFSNIEILHLNVSDLILLIKSEIPESNYENKEFNLNVDGREIKLDLNDRNKYREGGLEFVDCNYVKEKEDDNFYSGARITWKEIKDELAVERADFRNQLERVKRIIYRNKKIEEITIYGAPGTGTTTYSRQLAYYIDRDSRSLKDFQCTPIYVTKYNPTSTYTAISNLCEKINNTPLLIVFEDHVLNSSIYSNLKNLLSEAQKNIVFVRVSSTYKGPNNNIELVDILNTKEREKFNEKYSKHDDNEEKIKKINQIKQIRVIDYPLVWSADQVSNELSSYINKLMDKLPEKWKEVCYMMAFIHKYTKKSCSLSLFKSSLEETNINRLKERKVLEQIIIEETKEGIEHTNLWHPRYSVFSDFILAYRFKCTNIKNWVNASNLYDLANNLISIYERVCSNLSYDEQDILISLFTERYDIDFRKKEDRNDYIDKFSQLIHDINDYEYVRLLMKKLVKTYPDNSYFLAHYSRLLYEKAHSEKLDAENKIFDDAEKYIENAISRNQKNDKVYHMQGTLYLRRIQSLLNKLKDSDNADTNLQEKLNEWTRKAKKALEQSELYAPESTYGYVSECKVYRDCIKTAKKLLHEKNYDFTEKDPWCEYVDWFNAAMRNVLELIRNVDESNIEEISSLRQFHMQIVKHTDDDASLYYKRSFDNELNQSLQLHYSQMFFWATFYANEGTTNTKDISKTLKKLPDETRVRMEKSLNNSISLGDITAFKLLHELKQTGNAPYSIDDAILLWKRCKDNSKYSKHRKASIIEMEACYMLAIYHSIRYILAGLNGENEPTDEVEAKKYFEEANKYAKINNKSTVTAYYFLGEGDEACALISANDAIDKRRKIKCKITEVNQSQGKASILPCGLQATFRPSKFTLFDKGRTLEWQIGFKYQGIGLYLEHDNNDKENRNTVEEIEEKEEFIQNLSEDGMSKKDEEQDDIPNNLDNAESDKIYTDKLTEHVDTPRNFDSIYSYGKYIEAKNNSSKAKIECNGYFYEVRSQIDTYIEDGTEVMFIMGKEPNKKDPSKIFRFAKDVKMTDD